MGATLAAETAHILEYRTSPDGRSKSAAIRVGVLAAGIGDLALAASVFIWNCGRIWGPLFAPPLTVDLAHPIFCVSAVFGIVGLFASALGCVRPAPLIWKLWAIVAAALFLCGIVCVVFLGLL
jgi:hypothetical protein